MMAEFNHAESVWQHNALENVRQEIAEINALNEQLGYLDKNIKTLEDAILVHIAKASEKRLKLKELQEFYLN